MNLTMFLVNLQEFSLFILAIIVLLVTLNLILSIYTAEKLQYEYNQKHFYHEEMKKKKIKGRGKNAK